jgi:hypothetical protein
MQSLLLSVVQQLAPKYNIPNSEDFVADMCAILFNTAAAEPEPVAEKPKSKSKSKSKKEPEPVPEPVPEPEPVAEPVEDKKEAAKRKAAETRARNKAAKETAAKEVVVEAKVEPNVSKMTPAMKKHLKKGLEDNHREISTQVEKDFLAYLNGLSAADFKKEKKYENFVKAFLTPKPVPAEEAAKEPLPAEPEDMVRIEYKNKVYWVGESSKKVFYDAKDEEGCEATVRNIVGDFGMNEFRDMVWPEEE